ncbi:MAG: hypothetical protein HS128_23545 [Ideonella sp.]|nr:hypothetical protein [Ideonella sp.]
MQLAQRLAEYLAEAARPFDWATHNCCHFAAGWVRLIEGLDAMPLVPTPDAMQAWRLIASYGGLADAITQELGRAPIAPAEARLGDVVLMPLMSDRASVGISNGRVSMFLADDGSVLALPTLQAVHAWRIGAA